MDLGWAADLVTVIGFPLALVGLIAVGWQMRSDKLAVSAGAVAAMHISVQASIAKLEAAGTATEWETVCSDLLNELELSAAIYLDGQMKGRSGKLAGQYLEDVLSKLLKNDDVKAHMQIASHRSTTFANIHKFLKVRGVDT